MWCVYKTRPYLAVRFRLVIIAAGVVAALAAAATIATSLRVARVPPPLLRPDTNLQRVQHLLFDVFYTENWSNVKVAFGLAGAGCFVRGTSTRPHSSC